jgi:hypothetical protein
MFSMMYLHDVFKFYPILDYDRKLKELHGENNNKNDDEIFSPNKRAKKSMKKFNCENNNKNDNEIFSPNKRAKKFKKKFNMQQKKLRSCHIISS